VWFLRQIVEQINEMKPDLVAVTGDLVTHVVPRIRQACEILAALRGRVVVTLGNHDYTRNFHVWSGTEIAEELEAELKRLSIPVLRNAAMSIDHADGRLWIVGLEDLWAGRFSPQKAFVGVNRDEPIIALSHNPDTVFALEQHGAQWVLAGHTHGGQIRVPLAGAISLPEQHKRLVAGLFEEGRAKMYVSNGVGFRVRVRFRCRPEVPCFRLTCA
jgi:predicted MPP superfamily phosphohydrolase